MKYFRNLVYGVYFSISRKSNIPYPLTRLIGKAKYRMVDNGRSSGVDGGQRPFSDDID